VRVTQVVFNWIYSRPKLFPLASDCLTWLVGLTATLTFSAPSIFGESAVGVTTLFILAVIMQSFFGQKVGIYRLRWRVSSFDEVIALVLTWGVTAVGLVLAGIAITAATGISLSAQTVVTAAVVSLGLMLYQRVFWRRWWERHRRPGSEGRRRTVVFGAGDGGALAIRAMLADPSSPYYPVALIDDNPTLANRRIEGVEVGGTRRDLKAVAALHRAEVLLLAIVYATAELVREASTLAAAAGLDFRVLPSTAELVDNVTVGDVREPTVEDLLGREPIDIDLDSIADYLVGKRVLITGAGGSIGSELARQAGRFNLAKLYLLDRDESALHGVQLSIQGRALLDTDELIVANIRDRDRIMSIFHQLRPEVVFHTAALKHLTLLENHPCEGIKTNTVGTKNLLEAAVVCGVERFINISTDKAADPTSVLGATKLAAERLTAVAAEETGRPYVSVRFGNVLGSRGSVLPTFLDQIERGNAVTVTDPDVTRYFMTIPEAVRLVIQAGAIGDPGEVLVLDMGEPVKIVDLAQQLIDILRPGTRIEFTGLRPGEKLHEVLMAENEIGVARIHPRINHTMATNAVDPAGPLETIGPDAANAIRETLLESPLFKAVYRLEPDR
jgi:FlaA1/EpsC-like NDP-sugar epimerase